MTDAQQREEITHEIRRKAVRRLRLKVAFYWHAAVFVLAQGAMLAINRVYAPESLWFVWPLAGWGTALVFHALATFQAGGARERMLEAEIRRELERKGRA